MRCQEAQILLSTRRDLNMSQRAELDAHLGTCRVCAAARREEDRVGRLLAVLPSPNLPTPPRVGAAIAARSAGFSRSARRNQGLRLALSLGAVAVFAGLLLNIATGGRLGWLLFGAPPETQTAAQPEATPAGPAPGAATLLLLHQPGGAPASVIAWQPATDTTPFRVPMGAVPTYMVYPEITTAPGVSMQVPIRDAALSPDGGSLYVIEYGETVALVAYDARSGEERWRTALSGYTPYIALLTDVGGSLSVSPDGSRVFVRGVAPGERRANTPEPLELRSYRAADGQPVGAPISIPEQSHVLALSNDTVLTLDQISAVRVDTRAEGPWTYLGQPVSLAVGVPSGGPSALYGVTPDLKILEIDLLMGGLDIAAEVDLVPRGGFFFDQAAFSPYGQALVVGQNRTDLSTGALSSEVRIFLAGPWREVSRFTLPRELHDLAISADGATVYGIAGPAGARTWILNEQPQPQPTPHGESGIRGALFMVDLAHPAQVYTRPLDPDIVGIVGVR